ncbi:hypothetical protein MWU65_17055 [Cellulophaga sp. F20128]|uniref:DUF6747 family protein n=1 Tax=Cellulophaga sp. F20128 TaxID=2926413 RepID=UPI001FF2BE07|nr:DUF6747 family protein [Cellulophaga sp. F20128]MCK0158899.1 hypothetical protein [Cellulophaga sp. F20128]
MKLLLLIEKIYVDGFKNIGNVIIQNYFKAFAWLSFILFVVVLYAFAYRVATDFAF